MDLFGVHGRAGTARTPSGTLACAILTALPVASATMGRHRPE